MLSKYPQINIRSKNELAKQISGTHLSFEDGLYLINDSLTHFNEYWYDSKTSKPDKNKFVRSAVGNNLGKLLKLINIRVLAPHDHLIPNFIFGGISKRNHVQAAAHLLGNQRTRSLVKTDLSTFFEQVGQERVFTFFQSKCGCSPKGAHLLSKLCCVPLGAKGTRGTPSVLARGFSTSPRLAVWCNLGTFTRLNYQVSRLLRGKDARISIYVDDIGISASRVQQTKLEHVAAETKKVIEKGGLKINEKKTFPPVAFSDGAEYVGARLGRNKLCMGSKSQKKLAMLKNSIKRNPKKRKGLKQSLKGLRIYQAELHKYRA